MLRHKNEIFIDTDIIRKHIAGGSAGSSVLTLCKQEFDECYTSVLNAAEIFSDCGSGEESDRAKEVLGGLNVLGIPFRYSVRIGEITRELKKKSPELI